MENYKLDELAKNLFDDISKDKEIFRTKIVIVPSIKTEAYLKSFYLKNYDSVLMNVKFLTFNKAILELFNIDYEICNNNQIRNLIINYLNNYPKILNNYLSDKKSNDYYIKLFDASNELTKLFDSFENDNAPDNIDDYKDIYNSINKTLKNNNLMTLKGLLDDKLIDKNTIRKNYDIYLFGFLKYSYLETKIINELIIKEEYKLKVDVSKICEYSIMSCPSKLREIEYLHSEICKLLADKNNRYTDFLVLGNNMNEYEDTITRVFNQDNLDYPNIPYYVNSSKVKNNNVFDALLTIKEIINKGFFSRLDFDNLITNNAIKYIRGITDTDISNWRMTISDVNCFSNLDWKYLKNRILLSKLTNVNTVDIGGNEYVSYSRIGLDDESIVRFVKMIDDLFELIDNFKISDLTNEKWLIDFNNSLDKFLSIKDSNKVETNGYYKRVYDTFNYYLSNELYGIPTKTFLEVLIDSSNRNSFNKGDLFLSGITFTDIDNKSILNAKYVFIINASSDNLPIKKTKNAFNKTEVISYKDEEDAFISILNNANNKIFISFVSRDLKTDEEFFISNFVKKLKGFDKDNIKNISIDENRNQTEIFTNRAEKNKKFMTELMKGTSLGKSKTVPTYTPVINKVLTTSKLGEFLKEPLLAKAKSIFSNSDETMEDVINEYEPFELNSLDSSSIFKEIVKNLLEGKKTKAELIKQFDLRKQIPNIIPVIEEKILEELFSNYDILKEYIDYFGKGTVVELKDIEIPNGTDSWTLTNSSPFIKIENDSKLYYIPIKIESKFNLNDKYKTSICALMDSISNNYTNKELIIMPKYKSKDDGFEEKLNIINESDVHERLNILFNEFNDYSNNYFFDASILELEPEDYDELKKNIFKLFKIVRDSWNYYDDKSLFNYLNDLGYDEDNYKTQLDSYYKKQKQLIDKILK